jgi:putative flippase GtrA
VPVHTELAALSPSVHRLHRFLRTEFPFSWQIVIADNASTDGTTAIGEALARELPSVAFLRLERKGRGRALRAAWSLSDAQVVCYMDVDLSTDLRGLLPEVRDDGWFFDTELLVLAQRRGMRIHEVPVDWVDDPDSRVRIVRTAVDDLRGVARLMASSPIARFGAIGVLSTIAHALLFLALWGALDAVAANAVALALTAVANTALNRRFTFRVRGRAGLVRHHLRGALVFALTNSALLVLHAIAFEPPRVVELAVLVAANLAATVTRYVAMRTWVFAHRRRTVSPRLITTDRRPA